MIAQHHIEFQRVFRKGLTPKLHFMTHYLFLLEQLGPICSISSIRFESFQCIFKHIIKNNDFRKDMLKSCFFKIRTHYHLKIFKIKYEEDETPVFAVIDKIILSDDKVLIGHQQLLNIGFSDHYNVNVYKI